MFKGYLVIFLGFGGVFWSFLGMGGTLVIFDVLGVRWSVFRFWELFQSFSRFQGCISLFLGIGCVLDIFCV